MENKEADLFLEKMQWLDHNVEDYIDAACKGMELAPKIDQNTWFGQIEDVDGSVLGTFYLNQMNNQCRWFDLMDSEEASKFIVRDLERDLT